MSEEFLSKILTGDINIDNVVKWLQNGQCQDEEITTPCSRVDFVLYFISFLRSQTTSLLQNSANSVTAATEKGIQNESKKEIDSKEQLIVEDVSNKLHSSNVFEAEATILESPTPSTVREDVDKSLDAKQNADNSICVNTPNSYTTPIKNTTCDSTLSNVSPINQDNVQFSTPNNSFQSTKCLSNQSTPFKVLSMNSPKMTEWQNDSLHKKMLSTPNNKHQYNRTYKHNLEYNQPQSYNMNSRMTSTENNHHSYDRPSSARTNICIGDFIVSKHNQADKSGGKKKKTKYVNLSLDENIFHGSNHQSKVNNSIVDIKDENSFPEIGNQSQSRHQQKRRINPTRLNTSDQSANSFNRNTNFNPNTSFTSSIRFGEKCEKIEQTEVFKNQIFHPSEKDGNFETERNILKLEKEKLLQKFNTLNPTLKRKDAAVRKISSTIVTLNTEQSIDQFAATVSPSLQDVTCINELNKLSFLYNVILDLNLAVNFTAEMNFLISLLVSQETSQNKASKADALNDLEPQDSEINANKEINGICSSNSDYDVSCVKKGSLNMSTILNNVHNCIYFSLKTLNLQVLVLDLILDNATLRSLYQNVRVKLFCPELSEHFRILHTLRQSSVDTSQLQTSISNKNVCFITDVDSEENFHTRQSFFTFKKQRDLFYDILRTWENQHNSVNWNFSLKLGTMIHNLLGMSVSSSNTTHLARLFREQLIATCTGRKTIDEDSLPEVAGVSADRLNKLAQRLVAAPTKITPLKDSKPDFPDYQEFFRDFLIFADNSAFHQHVTDSLIEEIYRLNNTHFMSTDEGNVNQKMKSYYLSCVIALQILGKFLGFVISLPYRNPVPPPANQRLAPRDVTPLLQLPIPKEKILQSDIQLRCQTQPALHLQDIVKCAIKDCRLILTIPWVVQYLAMLDYSTLRLPYYKGVIDMLFQIYHDCIKLPIAYEHNLQNSTVSLPNINRTQPASHVLLKICIGWFFDMLHFPQQLFYSWIRKSDSNMIKKFNVNASREQNENKSSDDAITNVAEQVALVNINGNAAENISDEIMQNSLVKQDNELPAGTQVNIKVSNIRIQLGSIDDDENGLDFLEIIDWNIILNTCPHLKELRCMLLSNLEHSSGSNNKTYRHITPVTSGLTEDTIKKNKEKQIQVQLEEWFIRSQSQSTSRVLRSVGERVGSALLRLIRSQIPYLKTLSQCGALHFSHSCAESDVVNELQKFNARLMKAFKVRCTHAAKLCGRERTISALKGMLAPATAKPVFNLLVDLSVRRAIDMVTEWLNNNINTEILCYDVNPDTSKISKVIHFSEIEQYLDVKGFEEKSNKFIENKVNTLQKENDFHSGANCIIKIKDVCLQLISGLIFKNGTEHIIGVVEECVKNAELCSQCSYIQTATKAVIGQLSVDLAILMVALLPSLLTSNIMNTLKIIWNNCFKNSIENNEAHVLSVDTSAKKESNIDEVELFQRYMSDNGSPCNTTIGTVNESIALLEEENLSEFNKSLSNIQESVKKYDIKMEDDCNTSSKQTDPEVEKKNKHYFDTILCPRNILYFGELGGGSKEVWKKLAEFLAFLIKNDFVTEDSITEQCLAVYRQEWPQNTLENLSSCIKELSEIYKISSEKLRLFLDFVIEFCHNISGEYLDME